jgi:hypothetical protein
VGRPRSWTDDQLAAAVRAEVTVADVARRLGLKPSGGVHTFLSLHIARLELDTTHMTGKSSGKAMRFLKTPRPLEEILVKDSDYSNTGVLRRRLIAGGLKEAQCEMCDRSEWMGQAIRLELDHINGDRRDNRLENLRILCPNCHSLTETWCRRKTAMPT